MAFRKKSLALDVGKAKKLVINSDIAVTTNQHSPSKVQSSTNLPASEMLNIPSRGMWQSREADISQGIGGALTGPGCNMEYKQCENW